MDEPIQIDFGEHGGIHRFRSYDDLLKWAMAERARWVWLESTGNFGGVSGNVLGPLTSLVGQIQRTQAEGVPLKRWQDDLKTFFAPHAHPVIEDSKLGRQVAAIREAHGNMAAAAAFALQKGWIQINSLSTVDHLKGAIALAVPWSIDPVQASERLAQERDNSRQMVRRLIAEAEEAEDRRNAAVMATTAEARRRTVRWLRSRTLVWARQRREGHAKTVDAVREMDATRAAYNEFMQLQAPVEYWQKKAAAHLTAEGKAFVRLVWFFPSALLILVVIFGLAAAQILQPGENRDTSVYFVISAGLATIAGVIFWVGRLLTRLYLSEHHLRKDAEEREIMTRTYLALTKDKAAEESDRHIVLSALFRNASDGIVREDAGEGSLLSSVVSRFGMGR